MGKGSEYTFPKRRHTNANRFMKEMLKLLLIEEVQMKMTVKIPVCINENGYYQKDE
jgi:hypothetical protein